MQQKPRFSNNDPNQFFSTLKKRVDNYFKEHQLDKQANQQMVIKSIAMLSIYLLPYFLILTGFFSIWAMLGLVIVMALGKAGIGMSVMHDANHGAYSAKSWLNNLMSSTFYLLGGSPAIWRVQHNVLHHTYTNVYEIDEDIETKVILRLSPHAPHQAIHRYQHLYAFALYGLMTFSLLIKDFIKVFRYHRAELSKKGTTIAGEFSKMILFKSIYLFLVIGVPYLWLNLPIWVVLSGFFILHFITGFVLSIVFQLAHVVEGTEHYHLEQGENLENSWAIHQLKSTANFARNNSFLNWYLGGLNFQVEHHLFPHICHIHYRQISDIVRNTALEFGLPYHEHPTFGQAVLSHYETLKKLGQNHSFINA